LSENHNEQEEEKVRKRAQEGKIAEKRWSTYVLRTNDKSMPVVQQMEIAGIFLIGVKT
jgi:hypothetical protein